MNHIQTLSVRASTIIAAILLSLTPRVFAQPTVAITSPTDGTTVSAITTVTGWVTNASALSSTVTFSLRETDLGNETGRFWNGTAWTASEVPLATTLTGTNWTKASSVTLPPLNSGISYVITATARDTTPSTATTSLTVTRTTDVLVWDPGTSHLGTQVKNNPHTLGGPFIFKIVTLGTSVGGWRSALNVTSGEADLYLSQGGAPNTNSYYYSSAQPGSDGFVLNASQFTPSQEWYYLVDAKAGATWNLVSGEPFVLDLGALPGPTAAGTTNVTMGAEGYRFFRTTTPASLPAWELWLGGAKNLIEVRTAFIPFTGLDDHEQSGAMLLVPDYLAGNTTYFIGIPGSPGQALSFTSKQQPVTIIPFSSTTNNVVVTGFPYTTYQVAVPINPIAWDVSTTPVSGDPNVAARRGKVPNEFNSDAFSEVPGSVQDSFTLVPPSLSDGTFYITVYSTAAHTFNLSNGEPTITPRAFIGTTVNDQVNRAGWRFYVLTNITEQIGVLGWELELANQVPGTQIALRRNAVPSSWYGRSGGATSAPVTYEDFVGSTGFLQRPGHQADIWYIGIYQPTANLGAFSLTTRALPSPPVAFNTGVTNVTGLAEARWAYFQVVAPADMLGWDLRLTNVTSGTPQITVRRDLLPDGSGGWIGGTDWPSGAEVSAGGDWTGLPYSALGVDETGRLLTVGHNNFLQPGTYYVGVYSGVGAASFTLVSRGIGTNHTIGLSNLSFSGTTGKTTNSTGLAVREAAYYQIVVPANVPNWLVKLTPTSGEAMLAIEKDVLPNVYVSAYGNANDAYGKSLRKIGNQHYLLLPAEGKTTLDAQTNFLAVIGRGVNTDYPDSRIGSNSVTYVLESLGSLPINNLGTGALPAFGGGPLTEHITLEGGEIALRTFTVPAGVAAMQVSILNGTGNPVISIIPGTNAPFPHVPASSGETYGADGGWYTGRRESASLMTFGNPTPGTWTVALKAEQAPGGDFPDATFDVQIVAQAPAPLTFNGANTSVTGHPTGTWQYYVVQVPADAQGWDLRLINVTSGNPQLTIRRDLLPDETGAPAFGYPDWPSGAQLAPQNDWTGRPYNTDDSINTGRLAVMTAGNSLTSGTYYVGVFNYDPNPAAYTLVSQGIGAGYSIPVTPLNFSGAGSAITNSTGIAARNVDYYRVVVPANTPSWHLRVTPDAGGELLLVLNRDVLPNSYGNPYVPFTQHLQKPGKELFTWFPDEGNISLPAGTNYLAVVSEGGVTEDGQAVGSGAVTYRIESLGAVPVVDLGALPAAGPPITQHVTLDGAEVKLFRFNTTTVIPTVEARLTNRIANPVLSLRPGTNAPVPQVPYTSGYYGVAGGYGSFLAGDPALITLANVASGIYTFTVFAEDDGSGTFPDAAADITITPHPPAPLAYVNGSDSVTGQVPGTWRFFQVTVPSDTMGWELRLTGVGSGPAHLSVRRDSLPEPGAPGVNIFSTTWPSNGQIDAGGDWTGLDEADGTPAYGHYLGFGLNNPLEPGNYYVGVLNQSPTDTIGYTLTSRGVGGSGGIPITTLAFTGTNAPAPLAPRGVAYYQVTVPANTPSWHVRLDTSLGGESSLVIHKDYVPNIANANNPYASNSTGKGLAKSGNEQYVLFPDDTLTNIAAGTYYLAVISEGVNPAPPQIGTSPSSFALESHGVLPITELGQVPAVGGAISNHVTLEGGETKAFHFTVPGGANWVELRLANATGNPAFAERPGAELPVPGVPDYGADYGDDGGWYSGVTDGYTFLTLIRPPATNTVTLKAEASNGGYPDAVTDLVIKQLAPTSLVYSNGLVSGSLSDNQRIFYQVTVPTNQIGWRLQLSATDGTPTLRVRKDLLPSDAEPAMSFGGPSVIIAPPFLQPGTWFVEVKGGGATDFSLTSEPVVTQRPSWNMPVFGAPITTPGLTGGTSVFADTGFDTNGVALPGDLGTDLGVGDFHFYSFNVPAGNAGLLRAQLLAISGNPQLFVRYGGVPTQDHLEFGYEGASLVDFQLTGTATEYANWVPLNGRTDTQLTPGLWYISVRANASNVRYRLLLSVGAISNLASGTTLPAQVIAAGDWSYYRILVPSNAPQSMTITWSQQQGDADLYLRDTIPPGEPLNGEYRTWSGDYKNGGPYPAFPNPGSYTLNVPPVRPNTALYLGFHAVNDSTFTVGVTFNAQNLNITNVVAFYGGSKTVTVPPNGIANFRVPVPADATSWRHTSTHTSSVQVYLDQGTLPDLAIPFYIWGNNGTANSQLIQYLSGWPWVPNQHYFLVATNTSATPQTFTLNMDGRNAATDDTDNDGLPDSWEMLFFGNLLQDGAGDFDGDGVSNAQEFAEGTNPANATSFNPRLNISTNGPGQVIIEPNLPYYTMGQTVTITAVPSSGQFFNFWSGSTSSVTNPLTVTMNTNKFIIANFTGTQTPLIFTNRAFNLAKHFTVTINGPAGSDVVIQSSSDLKTWLPLTTNAPFTGSYLFEDTNSLAHPVRYYRARFDP